MLRIAAGGAALVFRVLKKERQKTIRNLTAAFGGCKPPAEIEAIARKVFVNLSKNLIDWILLDRMSEDTLKGLVDIEGREKIERVLSHGKGVIVLTAHIGNWEYLAAYVALFIRPGGVVGRKVYIDQYDRLLVEMRRKKKIETIYSTDSPKRILKILKDNCVVGILPDQDVGYLNGVFVDFFGRQAYTPTGPAAISLASGAAIVPAFLIRQDDDRFRIHTEEPISVSDTGDKKKDIFENTQKWSAVCERYILRYPDQWVWMHNRWKTRGAGKQAGSIQNI
jgi:KDO2-lipid IV(A) lauroyltransferase